MTPCPTIRRRREPALALVLIGGLLRAPLSVERLLLGLSDLAHQVGETTTEPEVLAFGVEG